MTDYQQPHFYRFNQDSLLLVKWILKKEIRPQHILDLGAGSGIIGIELANALAPETLTLLELQQDYLPYLESNLLNMKQGEYAASIQIKSFGEWKSKMTYDLIVANPPYYLPGHGEASQDPRKGMARSFIVDDWSVLLQRIREGLTADGTGYLVIKNEKTILEQVRKSLNGLKLQEHLVEGVVILELTRLNKDGHHQVF